MRHRARSGAATQRIAPPPPACRAPQGSGWSVPCRDTGWQRHPMGCSQRKQSPDPLGHCQMKLSSSAVLPLQTPAAPKVPKNLVAAILQQGWAARLLVSPHSAPPGLKTPTTGTRPQAGENHGNLSQSRSRPPPVTEPAGPPLAFRLRCASSVAHAASSPQAHSPGTIHHNSTWSIMIVLMCVGVVTISPSGNPALGHLL